METDRWLITYKAKYNNSEWYFEDAIIDEHPAIWRKETLEYRTGKCFILCAIPIPDEVYNTIK